jgi:hypothetical protein
MVGSITIHGSGGDVLVPLGGGTFVTGTPVDIRITAVISDTDVPLAVREGLVGMVVRTYLDAKQANGVPPPGSRLAYAPDVVDVLRENGKEDLGRALRDAAPDDLTLLVFQEEEYELA